MRQDGMGERTRMRGLDVGYVSSGWKGRTTTTTNPSFLSSHGHCIQHYHIDMDE